MGSGDRERPSSRRRDNVQLIHRHLRDEIVSGRLAPGTELSQVKLAVDFAVSRGPVREALRLIEREGLIDARPNHRVVVRSLSATEIEELYALRIVTDALALRVGVSSFGPEDLDAMRAALGEMDDAGADSDFERWELPHRRFHALLASHGGRRIVAASAELADHAERYRRFYLGHGPAAWRASFEEHHSILEACESADAEAAVDRLARHLARTALTVLAMNAPEHDPRLVREALRTATGAAFAELETDRS